MDQGKDEDDGKGLSRSSYGFPQPPLNYPLSHMLSKHPDMEQRNEPGAVPPLPLMHQPYLTGGSGPINPGGANLRHPVNPSSQSCPNTNSYLGGQPPYDPRHLGQVLHPNYDMHNLSERTTMSVSDSIGYSNYNNIPSFNSNNYNRSHYSSDLSSNGCLPSVSSPIAVNYQRPPYPNLAQNAVTNPYSVNPNVENSEDSSNNDQLKKNKRVGGPPIGAPAPKIKRRKQKDAIQEYRSKETNLSLGLPQNIPEQQSSSALNLCGNTDMTPEIGVQMPNPLSPLPSNQYPNYSSDLLNSHLVNKVPSTDSQQNLNSYSCFTSPIVGYPYNEENKNIGHGIPMSGLGPQNPDFTKHSNTKVTTENVAMKDPLKEMENMFPSLDNTPAFQQVTQDFTLSGLNKSSDKNITKSKADLNVLENPSNQLQESVNKLGEISSENCPIVNSDKDSASNSCIQATSEDNYADVNENSCNNNNERTKDSSPSCTEYSDTKQEISQEDEVVRKTESCSPVINALDYPEKEALNVSEKLENDLKIDRENSVNENEPTQQSSEENNLKDESNLQEISNEENAFSTEKGEHHPNETPENESPNEDASNKDTDPMETSNKDGNLDEEGDGNTSDAESKKQSMRKAIGTGTGLSAKPKVKNLRRNIREIISEDKLEENTLAAQKEEQLRLQRLQEKRAAMREYMEQQQVERLVAEVAEAAEAVTAAEAVEEVEAAEEAEEELQDPVKTAPERDDDIVVLSSEEDGPKNKSSDSEPISSSSDEDEEEEELLVPKKEIKSEQESVDEDDDEMKSKPSDESESDSDSDVVVLSHSEEEDDDEDVSNSGAHINDEFNLPDSQGRVLVNLGHPEKEEDVFLAPQLAGFVKPHQIGGIRFLYDNIIESLEQFKTSNGFGCILAHSMGLGKTLQVVSFTDIFLRHTNSKHVLIVVPINTLQNWLFEYNQWLPEEVPSGLPEGTEFRPRQFKVFVLNDAQKTLPARARVIREWYEVGGVLLMGYELYRQISLKKPKKSKKKKKKIDDKEIVDIEEEDQNKVLLDEMQKALVRPGPDLIICDEGHRIKNAHANISQALKNIRTKRRVVLTGYPLQNNLLEYWCMVDFVRPNYLGTKTEFCNMFERPIQNGQCVDSTPQDVKVMRYRAHVLHSLLEGFVQRRGHTVLEKTLPTKQEHVLLCRMTPVQRKLYSAFMVELKGTKATANPLKAFAICCKIWNHPDVMYNFVMKRMNEDFDLDIDEVVNKLKKGKKGQPANEADNPPASQTFSNNNWPSNSQMIRPGMNIPPQHTMQNVPPGMPMQNNMNQQVPPQQPIMHPSMGHSMGNHSGNMPQHPGMSAMGGYGIGMFNMQQQGYNMHQMPPPPPYPWGNYSQGYQPPPNQNDPNLQQYQPQYATPYPSPQYPHHPPPSQNHQQPNQMPPQQQQMPPSSPFSSPMMPPHMQQHSMNMVPPPAHPSMHPQSTPQSLNDPNRQNTPQQRALNLSHPTSNPSMHPPTPEMQQNHQQPLPGAHAMLNQSSPNMHDQGNPTIKRESLSNPSTPASMMGEQSNSPMAESLPSIHPPHSQMIPPEHIKQENLSQNTHFPNSLESSNPIYGNPLPMQQGTPTSVAGYPGRMTELSGNINSQMKDLALEESKEVKTEMSAKLEVKQWFASGGSTNTDSNTNPTLSKKEGVMSVSDEKKESIVKSPSQKETMCKEDDEDSEDLKKEEKMDLKKEELSFEWADSLLKDYVPGLLENSAKFQVFFKILDGALKVNDRLLVFSQSLFTLSILEEFLQRTPIPGVGEAWARNRTYFRLDGSTSAQDRDKLITEFNANPNVRLFLVSTRAGSLGINLVGANRVVVFDASFNPCHDTQAVCRVYRYGQQKACHIYRLVTDNSLERRIYDRQVNKQGIADRIVDEMNPEAHLSSKEIGNLLVDNEEDPEPEDFSEKADLIKDEIISNILKESNPLLTRAPFNHESLLVDRKDKKLSSAEKRLAKRSYELEKQANISYGSRPSYGGFYPKTSGGQPMMMGTKIGGVMYAKPVGTVRPMQSELGHKIDGGGSMIHRPNILSRSSYPVESLAKQGVSVQQITVPKDVSIPTNSGDGKPIQLKAGQSVMVIKTQKGMYLRLSDGKIVAIRVPPGSDTFGLPLNQGSVTIVPTMINSPRGRGRGGIMPTRRGRPPMSAQYALGQVIPKGASKGQMAVRILRKPVVTSRGGKTYQTIAVPISSQGGTLLNKSVVITPAKSGGQAKSAKDLKISPKVQITPVPNKPTGLSSIAGTSGLNRRLNRNTRIMSAQAAFKTEEEKKFMKMKSVIDLKAGDDSDLSEDESENVNHSIQSKEAKVDSNPIHSPVDGCSGKIDQNKQLMSPLGSLPNLSPKTSFEDIANQKGSPRAANMPVLSDKPQKPGGGVTEPLTGIVRPMVHHSTDNPLEGLNNLIPPDEGPGPPLQQTPTSDPSSFAIGSSQSFNSQSTFSSSQPLFQPFLQQAPARNPTSSPNVTVSGSTSNVAHVAPQIQDTSTDLNSQTFISSSAPPTLFTNSTPTTMPLQGLQPVANNIPFSLSDTSLSSQMRPQMLSSSAGSTLPTFTHTSDHHTSVSSSTAGENPLSLSNLLSTQSYSQPTSEEQLHPPPSSTIDYLNYSIAGGGSAFRRPEFPPISSDLQTIVSPTSSAANTTPTTDSPTSTASPTPTSFSDQQYAYRGHPPASPGFRTPTYPYPSQYPPPYASQYPSLNPHPAGAPQATPMSQYSSIQPPANLYQGYTPPSGTALPPYPPPGLGGFGPTGSYPPM